MAKKPKVKDQEELLIESSLGSGAFGADPVGSLPVGGQSPDRTKLLIQRIKDAEAGKVDQTFRASIYAEQAKIRNKEKARQLLLGEGISLLDADKKTAEFMPSFSYQELRVYSAIQRFIDEQYKPGEELEITFTPQEFYEYCGLKKNSGKTKEEYKQALWGLATTPKKIIQQQTEYEKGRKRYKTYILTSPLLTVKSADIIESDTAEEAQEVMERAVSGKELPKRKRTTRYLVKPDPIMYKLLDRFYVRKAISQHEEIMALHPGEKPTPYSDQFLDLIQTYDFSPIPIGRDTLAERIGLDGYLRQRKQKEVNKYINKALEDALATRYILSYKEEATGLLIIHLNPERCSVYAERLKKADKEAV